MDKRCPRKLKNLPSEVCSLGENAALATGEKSTRCPWFVNDKESHYCVWKWLDNRNNDGATKAELATLLNSNLSSINICEIKTIKKFTERFQRLFPNQFKFIKKTFKPKK